jgi:hypothetical protein
MIFLLAFFLNGFTDVIGLLRFLKKLRDERDKDSEEWQAFLNLLNEQDEVYRQFFADMRKVALEHTKDVYEEEVLSYFSFIEKELDRIQRNKEDAERLKHLERDESNDDFYFEIGR